MIPSIKMYTNSYMHTYWKVYISIDTKDYLHAVLLVEEF